MTSRARSNFDTSRYLAGHQMADVKERENDPVADGVGLVSKRAAA
jgi:hypothetical protein